MPHQAQKDQHSPIIHTDLPTLDQTKPDPDATSVPTRHAPEKEIKTEDERIRTGTR